MLYHSKYARGSLRAPTPENAGEVVAHRFEYNVTGDEVLDDIIELAPLPAYMRVVDMVIDSDDLDDGAALALDVGVMSGKLGESLDEDGNARTCGAEFFDGDTVGQAGGVSRMALATGYRVAPVDHDRAIGVKIAAAAGTGKAGKVAVTVLYGT